MGQAQLRGVAARAPGALTSSERDLLTVPNNTVGEFEHSSEAIPAEYTTVKGRNAGPLRMPQPSRPPQMEFALTLSVGAGIVGDNYDR